MTNARSGAHTRHTPQSPPQGGAPPLRTYASVGAFLADVGELAGRLPDLWSVWVARSLDPSFREALMVAVAAANRCRTCSFMHYRWARTLGVRTARLERIRTGLAVVGASDEDTALAWVRALAAADFVAAPPELEEEMRLAFGSTDRRHIETVARAMNLANRASNTFEALRRRAAGRPVPGSRLPVELLIGGGAAAAMPGALLLLAGLERRSPLALLDAYRRFSARLEAEWGTHARALPSGHKTPARR